MKRSILHRLLRYTATYHFLSCFVIFLVVEVNGVSGKSEIRTKLLLQNIRTHLAQKVEEIVQQKECESGLTLCKNIKSKEVDRDEEKSEEILPPPKIVRGFHKPVIKVSPKDVIHTLMPKAHKSFLRKAQKDDDIEPPSKLFSQRDEESKESDESIESVERDKPDKKQQQKAEKPIPKPVKSLPENKNTPSKISDVKSVPDKVTSVKIKQKPEVDADKKIKKVEEEKEKQKKKPTEKIIKTEVKKDDKKDINLSKTKSKKDELEQKVKKEIKKEEVEKKIKKEIKKEEVEKKIKKEIKKDEVEKKVKKEIQKDEKKTAMGKPMKKDKIEEKFESEKKTKDEFIVLKNSFIYILDPSKADSDICRKHSQIYLKQLKKLKIWALMMFDASAKLPSGILQGNANQYGDFDECLSINAVFKKAKSKSEEPSGIRGKYCLANLDVSVHEESEKQQLLQRIESFDFVKSTISDPAHFIPRFSSVNWGLCVPSSCPAGDVENFIKSQLSFFNNSEGFLFDVKVEEENCAVKDDLKVDYDLNIVITIVFYFIIIGVAVYATYTDSQNTKSQEHEIEKELEEASNDIITNDGVIPEQYSEEIRPNFTLQDKLKNVAMAFSLKRNIKKLFSDPEGRGCIECINGIKSVFTITLYFAHKIIPITMTPFSNRIFLTKISNEASTVLLRTSIVYTDSFLLISGLLISYNLSKEISDKGKISWIRKFFGRYIRLTPALLAVVLFYAYIWEQLGSGPMWNPIVKKNAELCQKYMWRNLLYIQNFFAFENMCAPQTHQLALDMHLSILAPFFVQLLYKFDKIGVGILQALFLLSSIMRYISTANNNLSVVIYHGMPVSQLYKTANLLYAQTLHRASPYILGCIVGFYLKKFEKKLDVPKAFVALGWIIAFSLGFYSLVSPSHLAFRNYQYDVQEAAQYAALSPVAWSIALAWLIVACHLGYGGKLNEFLCKKSLLVFSRISYSMYLTQFLVFFYKVGVKRLPEIFTVTGSFDVAEFLTVVVISVFVTLLFDIPMLEIKKIILNERSVKSISHTEDETSESKIYVERSVSQTTEDSISQEESRSTDDIEYPEEEIGEEELRETYEEELGEEGVGADDEELDEDGVGADEEREEEVEDEDIGDNNDVVVNFEFRPLRRSSRIHFDDESEDKEWYKVGENERKSE